MGALAKDPEHRWQSADDFAAALEAARARGARRGPTAARTPRRSRPCRCRCRRSRQPPAASRQAAQATGGAGRPSRSCCSRSLCWRVAVYALTRPEQVDVPQVDRARRCSRPGRHARARAASRRSRWSASRRSLAERDEVLRPGSRRRRAGGEGRHDHAVVSSGPGREVLVPSVRNLPQEQAVKDLNQAGFKVNARHASPRTRSRRASPSAPSRARAREVERGTARDAVHLERPRARRRCPDVVGLSRDSAEERLTPEGLDVAIREEESDEREDEVIAQDPAGGHAARAWRDRHDHGLDRPSSRWTCRA